MSADSTRPAIEIKDLTKAFGAVTAVDQLSFTIPTGAVAGFVGPNGSGKSTTMRILATLERQDYGTAKVFGMDVRLTVNLKSVRRLTGFMPDYFGLYPDMRVADYLEFFAAAHRIPPGQRRRLVDDILAIVDLSGKRETLIGGLSRGMQQKLALGRTLVHDPGLLILDEPASGLDPRARVELLECLRELQEMGKTILVSSHILTELQALCDMFVIIAKGRLVYAGPMSDAPAGFRADAHHCEITVAGNPDAAAGLVRELAGVQDVRVQRSTLHLTLDGTLSCAALIRACVLKNVPIEEVKRSRPSLEDLFMALTDDA